MFANMKASYSMHNESINYPYYDKKLRVFFRFKATIFFTVIWHLLVDLGTCQSVAINYNCFTAIAFLILFEMVYLHL